jgi:hypothetical protein
MSIGIEHNRDLSARLASLLTNASIVSVMEQQPVRWRPAAWQDRWRARKLPHPQVLDELQQEYAVHGTIRRSFVFTYHNRAAVELFIAVMAWGLGPDNRGPAKADRILELPNAATAIEAVVNSVRQDGAAAGYSTYYSGHKLPRLDVAFITKLLYFAGYQGERRPRPLIYDSLVAAAVVRLPDAPLLPWLGEGVTVRATAYEQYCCWAEKTAAAYGTEPTILEWALFSLGGQIRDELRA